MIVISLHRPLAALFCVVLLAHWTLSAAAKNRLQKNGHQETVEGARDALQVIAFVLLGILSWASKLEFVP